MVSGGSGNYQYDYYWVDETNVIIWEAPKMAPTTTVTEYDLGKIMKCLVTTSDKTADVDPLTLESNSTIEAFRPTLDDYGLLVNGSEVDPSDDLEVEPGATFPLEVKATGDALYPPKDVKYEWKIRSGTGRFSGSTDQAVVIYIANDSAPSGAVLQCVISSPDAQDQMAVDVQVVVTGP